MRLNKTAAAWTIAAGVILVHALQAHAQSTIYRCEVDGRITYSDVACPLEADKTQVPSRPISTYSVEADSTRVPSTMTRVSNAPKERHRKPSIAEEQAKHKERCKELKARLDAITDKLWRHDSSRRTSTQREQLRSQEAAAQSKLHAEKCH